MSRLAKLSILLLAPWIPFAATASDLQRTPVPAVASSLFRLGIAAAGDERTALERAALELERLLAQPVLWTNFQTISAQYPKIYVGPSFSADGTASPAQALALLRGTNSNYVFFPAQLVLTGTYYGQGPDYIGTCTNPAGQQLDCRRTAIKQNFSNMLAVTHGIGLTTANGREAVSVEIGREIFDRYNPKNSKLRRSCTYNTLAHEWTHTIGKSQSAHWAVVEDTDVPSANGAPQLSYLFGAVAQCTWLQQEREIGAGPTDLKACARKFSAVPFPNSLCV
jgi:hypothetical protein